MTGKKSKNIGQRNKYYVKDSHLAIVSAEVFDMVQKEMAKRARLISKEACPNSPTVDEGWVQDILAEAVCQNGVYDEGIIRNEVDKVQIYDAFILIYRDNGIQEKRLFRND